LAAMRNKKPPIMATLYLNRYERNAINADMIPFYVVVRE